ncbi:unnamed protein product [Polarella glacialis]|uniref:Uncharacterized protein n=1 Tax=Polarella glacialis TaxID=89957 RepID=A0A813IJ66_POLGL|nr:unnamed protein product [Polarella glacialis]
MQRSTCDIQNCPKHWAKLETRRPFLFRFGIRLVAEFGLRNSDPINFDGAMFEEEDDAEGQRTYTGGDVKRKPREDDSEEEWPDDAEFEFREDEKFLQARPTRIRPTGCFVKLPGGIEAFLPVEHMMPRTEASSTAVRERVQVKKGAGESRLLVRELAARRSSSGCCWR